MKHFLLLTITAAFFFAGCKPGALKPEDDLIKAYCIDFNWGEGGPNAFAAPGLWADASPSEHIQWYKDLGVNTVQTFIVSCNGYAWYKNGVVPPQPGLKYDFLPEMVRLGHQEGMKVMGYLCIGSNTRWGIENPGYSYGYPADRHLPYTQKYLDYLDELIRDAVGKTGIDGFMIDWFYQPNRNSHNEKWLESEKQRFEELMNKPFPGEEKLTDEEYTKYSRLAIGGCWDVIRTAARETNPECIIWLTCFDITHPHIVDSKLFQEVDWLMNEEGDVGKIDSIRGMVGEHTRLITCLANWNKKDPVKVVDDALKNGVGLYGFTKPVTGSLLPPVEYYLSEHVDSLKEDERNIAVLTRAFHSLPLEYVKK
jgi:hypothetical protein